MALNADVNLEDSVGNTPLDLVNLQHTLKKSGSGEFTLYPLNRHKKFLESGMGFGSLLFRIYV